MPRALDNWTRLTDKDLEHDEDCECFECYEREEMARLEYLEAQADNEIMRWKEERGSRRDAA